MPNSPRKLAIFSCFLFTGFCIWKAGTSTGLIGGTDAEILPSAQAAVHPSFTPPQVVTTPIQEMRPGMQIIGRNPLRIQTESTIDPTPEGWRLVSVQMRKPDGTYFEAELLRPLSWIRRHRVQPGAVIELNMPELHVVGAAEVLSVSACPPIDPGDGPVVISMFKNVADYILNIYVEGETEPIGVTAGHPIWSEDRQAFVHTDQLQPGERLRSALGKTVRITSIEIRAGPEPVYNLEVAGEHVYSVTDSGLLVHNTGQCNPDLYVFDEGSRSARLVTSREINAPTRQNIPNSLLDDIVGDANRVASPGGAITDAQRTALRQNLPVVQRRSAFQNRVLRSEFTRDQSRHIAEWERMTGRTWPEGATPHHVIPLESGGANAWWNLMPTHGRLPNHSLPGIPGPHAAGGELRDTIQQGRRALPPGTTTDLRRPQ